MAELEQWLTLERIAFSDFAGILFDGLHDGSWSQEAASNVAVAALTGFGNGHCYWLASAAAMVTGWPIAGFWRKHDPDMPLVHAVLHDPASGDALDILGRRPLGAIRDELVSAVGPVRISALPSLHPEIDQDELDVLSQIVAGLAWMPGANPATNLKDWGKLVVGYADARSRDVPTTSPR